MITVKYGKILLLLCFLQILIIQSWNDKYKIRYCPIPQITLAFLVYMIIGPLSPSNTSVPKLEGPLFSLSLYVRPSGCLFDYHHFTFPIYGQKEERRKKRKKTSTLFKFLSRSNPCSFCLLECLYSESKLP